jgi:hypothetical protein
MSTATPPVRALLPDGEVAWVRKLEACDGAAVLALRARLSGRDRHLMFFGLGVAGLAELSTQLSHSSGVGHTAVGCFLHSRLAGVARYDILADPTEAEVALVVDGHGPVLGVAALLLEQLAVSAEHEGAREPRRCSAFSRHWASRSAPGCRSRTAPRSDVRSVGGFVGGSRCRGIQAGVQPFTDLVRGVGPTPSLLARDHHPGRGDPDEPGQSHCLPPAHRPRLLPCRGTSWISTKPWP